MFVEFLVGLSVLVVELDLFVIWILLLCFGVGVVNVDCVFVSNLLLLMVIMLFVVMICIMLWCVKLFLLLLLILLFI